MKKECKRGFTARRLFSGALALVMTASILTEPAAALQSSRPVLLEASRLEKDALPEGDVVYLGTAAVTPEASDEGGTSDTTFSPDATMTRGMVAKVLHNLVGSPESTYKGAFGDVAPGAWYEEAVCWAAGEGIVSGYGNGLYPGA